MALLPLQSDRLVALFVLGWLLLGWPLLSLFDRAGLVFGVPLLYVWLFGAWAALIAAMALAVHRRGGAVADADAEDRSSAR